MEISKKEQDKLKKFLEDCSNKENWTFDEKWARIQEELRKESMKPILNCGNCNTCWQTNCIFYPRGGNNG